METYTYGTTPLEVIRERLPHKYDMSLNRDDMIAVVEGLNKMMGTEPAEGLRSSILQTIGIEEV